MRKERKPIVSGRLGWKGSGYGIECDVGVDEIVVNLSDEFVCVVCCGCWFCSMNVMMMDGDEVDD